MTVSFREDALVALASDRPPSQVYRDLRAGAESGWDYSSRWLLDGSSLATISTTAILPVDLNSLLYGLEVAIGELAGTLGLEQQQKRYAGFAQRRVQAMNAVLYDERSGFFRDFDWKSGRFTPSVSAASLLPLFIGLADERQAAGTARLVEEQLLAKGGLRTTTVATGQQWDMPNGWAPLQWFAVKGLQRYGFDDLARAIAERWIRTAVASFAREGRMFEKYDIEQSAPGGGGEYPLQDGFGWTNGVTAALMDEFCPVSD